MAEIVVAESMVELTEVEMGRGLTTLTFSEPEFQYHGMGKTGRVKELTVEPTADALRALSALIGTASCCHVRIVVSLVDENAPAVRPEGDT